MAKFSRLQVASKMESGGLVPLFFHTDIETVHNVLDACYAGGARILEFTNRGDFAHEVFSDLVKYTRQNYPDMMIGAGSIVDASTTALYLQSGADFIVSPILNAEMAEICNRQNVLWSPGCGTLTEIVKANELGADIVKIFPGSHLEPGFIKAVKGPCPWLKLMPTGGVSQDNLADWFKAGATCVGMGSKLIKKDLLQDRQFEALTDHIADTFDLVQSLKTNS